MNGVHVVPPFAVPAHETTAAPAATTGEELVRIRVWDLVVRVTHWTIVVAIALLAVTGIYIGHPFLLAPGEAGTRFVMGTMKAVHSYSAIAFTLAVAARVAWAFVGTTHARWWNFVPIHRERQRGIIGTLKFYLFLRRAPPPFAGHNPVAGLTYLAVFGLYLVMILTGWGMYAAGADLASPMHWFRPLVALFWGAQNARWIHHVVMWLLIGFTVHHIYSAILVANVEKNGTLDSIFSGYKWMRRDEMAQAAPGKTR
jgi:Ni/Fe-hydrogenase 1 B-type cytochrome subunit